MPYVDVDGIPQYDTIKTALENWLLDPCVMYLHPSEVMPRGQFLMVYFKAFKFSGKRPYLGEFCDLSRYEWDSGYVQTCIDENLIDLSTVCNGRFRPDDALTCAEFASFVVRGLRQSLTERNADIKECNDEAILLGIINKSSLPDEPICRADCYAGLVRVMEILDNADNKMPSDVEIHPVG
jgi:hypothetical protein